MTKHSPLACLSKAELFKDLPKNLREKLVTISTHQEYFPKGSLIRQPFDGKDGMLVMDKGHAKIYSLNYIQATTDTWICSMTRKDFQNLLQETPGLALRLLNSFGRKLVAVEQNAIRRNSMDAKERIMAHLEDLSKKQEANVVTLELKKKDLASLLGITPETLSRKLKELENENRIEVKGKQIRIL